MSYSDLKKDGMSAVDPLRLFVIGLDGVGVTEEDRIDWLKDIFPKLSARIDALRDVRACEEIEETKIVCFRPEEARPVIYLNAHCSFPEGEGYGQWSGLKFLPVVTGRQTTKVYRALGARREAKGAPALKMLARSRLFETDLELEEAVAIENSRILDWKPSARAWTAHRLMEKGSPEEHVMAWVGIKSRGGLKKLISILKCSPTVLKALDDRRIVQRVALDVAKKGDHDKQDVELEKRFAAAKGQKGHTRSRTMNGVTPGTPSPVRPGRIREMVKLLTARAATPNAPKDPQRDDALILLRAIAGEASAVALLPASVREVLAIVQAPKKPALPPVAPSLPGHVADAE